MSKKTWMVFVSLIILIGFVGIVYAQETCKDSPTIDCSTDPPTLKQNGNLADLPPGKFQTAPGATILLPTGGSITGSGTLNSDGTIKPDSTAIITTPSGKELKGSDVTYDPNTRSFDCNGVCSFDNKDYYNVNKVETTADGSIKGTAGKGCILPNGLGNWPENAKFTIAPPKDGVSEITIEGCGDATHLCNLQLYSQLATDNNAFRIKDPVSITTDDGKLDVTSGTVKCTSTECSMEAGKSATVNGVQLNTDKDVPLRFGPAGLREGIYFWDYQNPGKRSLDIVSEGANINGIITPGSFDNIEPGDTVGFNLSSKSEITFSENDASTITTIMKGENVTLTNDAHQTQLMNDKIYGAPTAGGNAAEMEVVFFNSTEDPITDKNGNIMSLYYNNVNAGNESLFTFAGKTFGANTSYIQFTAGGCAASVEGTGAATSFLGKAWAWLTGRVAIKPPCGTTVQSVKSQDVFKFWDVGISGTWNNKVIEIDDMSPNPCVMNGPDGKPANVIAIVDDNDNLAFLYVNENGKGGIIYRPDNSVQATVTEAEMKKLQANTNSGNYASWILNHGSGSPFTYNGVSYVHFASYSVYSGNNKDQTFCTTEVCNLAGRAFRNGDEDVTLPKVETLGVPGDTVLPPIPLNDGGNVCDYVGGNIINCAGSHYEIGTRFQYTGTTTCNSALEPSNTQSCWRRCTSC